MKQFILLSTFMVMAFWAGAQSDSTRTDSNRLFMIKTYHGGEFMGRIIRQDAREILIETRDRGPVIIPKYLVKETREVAGERTRTGAYTPAEVFSTRYFISTNGLPIKKGESYIQWNLWGPDFEFGVRKNFSLGVMTTWAIYPVIGTMKYSIPLAKKTSLGIGALLGTSTWFPEDGRFGFALPFASLTFGDRKRSLSFSGGYAYLLRNESPGKKAMFSLAGMTKVGRKTSLVFESFFVPPAIKGGGSALIAIPGLRIQTSSHKAFQVGLVMLAIDKEYLPFPLPMLQWFRKI